MKPTKQQNKKAHKMAWKNLKDIKKMPLGMALGTVAKMITGQNMSLKPRQIKKLSDEKRDEFDRRQEEEREKLFMVFANHFTAMEDIEKAREDFWGFVNYVYGTYALRSYVNVVLTYPDVIDALVQIYFKDEKLLETLTYNIDRATPNVEAFGRAVETNPMDLATLIEKFDGNGDKFIEALKAIEPAKREDLEAAARPIDNEDTEHREEQTAQTEADNSNTEEMKEAV
tara:strand:+ start:918 stop:1601 length:684 start_codon:yes stop_codon:yes gene_type:complete